MLNRRSTVGSEHWRGSLEDGCQRPIPPYKDGVVLRYFACAVIRVPAVDAQGKDQVQSREVEHESVKTSDVSRLRPRQRVNVDELSGS